MSLFKLKIKTLFNIALFTCVTTATSTYANEFEKSQQSPALSSASFNLGASRYDNDVNLLIGVSSQLGFNEFVGLDVAGEVTSAAQIRGKVYTVGASLYVGPNSNFKALVGLANHSKFESGTRLGLIIGSGQTRHGMRLTVDLFGSLSVANLSYNYYF